MNDAGDQADPRDAEILLSALVQLFVIVLLLYLHYSVSNQFITTHSFHFCCLKTFIQLEIWLTFLDLKC